MSFYDLSKSERIDVVSAITDKIHNGLMSGEIKVIIALFSDDDTYIRKSAYLVTGRLFFLNKIIRNAIIDLLAELLKSDNCNVRQTVINAAGEIGKAEFGMVRHFFDIGLFDPHHSVRNAVIGSVKKMGEVNPGPVLSWAEQYLHHPDKEIRREICHGIELRGRKHPEDILPLLKQLEFDKTARVRNTLIHVVGQIAYKKGCLEKVLLALQNWENAELVKAVLFEILDVHARYQNFAAMSQSAAIEKIQEKFKDFDSNH